MLGGSTTPPPLHAYHNNALSNPASLVNGNEKINPRAATDEYNLPPSLSGSPRSDKNPNDRSASYFLNPHSWETMDGKPEPDDHLHDPEAPAVQVKRRFGGFFHPRGLLNLGVLSLLVLCLLMMFAGYPIIAYYTRLSESSKGGWNLGGTNASGQVPNIPGLRTSLIDTDTPQEAYYTKSLDGTEMKLVFSDEFNTDGRSFYPGNDPFWEAVDLHYWGTNNYEWYTPEAITTKNGTLEITLSEVETHNLNFRSGFLSTWNKFCFTGGYIVASVQLPGAPNVAGLWPAFWTMGNLGRAGYGASVEGNWPYSYNACDVGTLMNQTDANGFPVAAQTGGDVMWNRKFQSKSLSFLPGQRLSACTCPHEDHPGPKLPNGTWKGRSAPEIDVFEAQVDGELGLTVSQSMQAAPFNYLYNPTNTSGPAYQLFLPDTKLNLYNGQNTQQALSGVSLASQMATQRGGNKSFASYGFQYAPGPSGYIEWETNGRPSWRLNPAALELDTISQISSRTIPEEPMYIIFNLGISQNFGTPDWEKLHFPAIMKVDWVRVYQEKGKENIGCDPEGYPTAEYIERHKEAYNNANLTTWGGTRDQGGYEADWPRNRLYPQGCEAPPSKFPGSPVQPYPKASPVPTSEIAVGQN